MASVAQAWPLLGPVAVGAEDWPEHSDSSAPSTSTSSNPTAAAAAYTTVGREVEFWLKIIDGVLLLHTNQLETLDPYGGDPIKSFPEVTCTHEDLFLLHLHTTHANFPTDYFVYDCNLRGGHGPRVYRLPLIKQPTHSRSMGLRRTDDGDGYVVANLRQELDWEKKVPKTYLDCYYSPSNKHNKDDCGWITREVEFLLIEPEDDCSAEEMLFGWRTDLMIPFDDDKHKALLWVDFSRGILLCNANDLLSSDDGGSDGKINLHFVPHPLDLFPEGDPRWEHPHPYCSVGCSNGKLMLTSLPSVRNNDACVVLTWTLNWGDHKWKEKKSTSLDHERLLRTSKVRSHSSLPALPKLADHSPCYPILSTAKSNPILYLTLVIESEAWLLRINMGTCSLDWVVDYPSFFDYMNPPYPCYLSTKYLNEADKGSSSPTPTHDTDEHSHPKHFVGTTFIKKIGDGFKKMNPRICIKS